jgi:tRNA(fMet)-specific endonuclease VapC
MTAALLLDTSIAVEVLRGSVRLSELYPNSTLYMSVIAMGELFLGAYRSQRPFEQLSFLNLMRAHYQMIPIEETTAQIYGQIKAELRGQGALIPENDMWIAATAIEHDLLLVSMDHHFERVPALRHQIAST